MKHRSLFVLALVLGGNAWAHDGQQNGSQHTHWWLDFDPSAYGGVAFVNGTFDVPTSFSDGSLTRNKDDDTGAGWRVFAGLDFNEYLALELGYADFGEAQWRYQSDGSGGIWNAGPIDKRVAVKAIDLAWVGKLPLSADFALFARVGASQWESRTRFSGDLQSRGPISFDETADDLGASYGAGVKYDGWRPIRVVAAYGVMPFEAEILSNNCDMKSLAMSVAYLF